MSIIIIMEKIGILAKKQLKVNFKKRKQFMSLFVLSVWNHHAVTIVHKYTSMYKVSIALSSGLCSIMRMVASAFGEWDGYPFISKLIFEIYTQLS